MKTTSIIILILTMISCTKKDTINHYLNNTVTQKELLDNGFYKYSMTYLEGESREKYIHDYEPTNPSHYDTVRVEVFSNIKPKKINGVPKGPLPIFNDSCKIENRNKIITYFFRNNSLEFKSIMNPICSDTKIKDSFKTQIDIKKYYDSLKISYKNVPLERLRNHNDSIGLRVRFIINNFESYFYLTERKEMITYYKTKKRGNEDMLVWNFYKEDSPYEFIE
jgi:hypothetical protein